MTRYKNLLLASFLILTGWACKTDKTKSSPADAVQLVEGSHGLHLENMDSSFSPREDFFHYANGGWINSHDIPAEESSWGVFRELREGTDIKVHEILKNCSADKADKSPIEQMIGDYYAAAMDSAAIEMAGLSPIQMERDMIDGLQSKDGLAKVLAHFHRHGISGCFDFWVDLDDKNSTKMVPKLYQGGTGLPDRDYYLDDSPRRVAIRKAYVTYIETSFGLTGDDEVTAAAKAKTVMRVETALAKASMGILDRRDPDKTYHKMDLAGLEALMPNFNWQMYFSEIGLPEPGDMVVGMPDFMSALSGMIDSYSLADWKVYLHWSLLRSLAAYLPQAYVMANFEFSGKTLSGTEEIRPRWQRVVADANHALGMAIGKKYADTYFSANAKQVALDMVGNILEEMKNRLSKLEWMSPETREQAIHKVSKIMPKIGYPDKWRDYSGMKVGRESYLRNGMNATAFNFQYRLDKVGKPVDKTEWGLPPQVVNAYYNPTQNEIVFPAGILQAPFFDEHVDMALNYGGFGAVIGHELIHAFDDQGSKFDADGNLKNWWTDADRENFEARTQKVVNQYNAYKVLDSLPINGRLTLGENIADIDGLRISFAAWQHSLSRLEADPMKDGFSREQRFFINYGQIWSSKMRAEAMRMQIATNPHSPAQYRVIGSTSNLPAFYAAFGIKEGDAMYRPDSLRMQIW
ncbi:MAG TPA: M13 family peptidase [Bacteroidetes bacterium]|nr:M13 family peptidase [Bacteroidota bacterium]